MSQLTSFRLTWSPEGKYIGTVRAKDAKSARRKAPLPYRKYLGEITVEEGSGPPVVVEEIPVKTVHARLLYRIDWYRNGNCFVSAVNGSLTGTYIDGKWGLDHALPDDIRALAMECKPQNWEVRSAGKLEGVFDIHAAACSYANELRGNGATDVTIAEAK